jgi:spore photoproduct lyase
MAMRGDLMPSFLPNQVLISREALRYSLGAKLADSFRERAIPVSLYEHRIPTVPLPSFRERYLRSKRTLVIAVRQRREFQTCKPSANYQLPLVSGCPGMCQYCYLNTNLGRTPYVRVYVNVDEILDQARGYVQARTPQNTVFEGAATSDPVAVEAWTGSLARAIGRFAQLEGARFRFATKYVDVDGFLDLDHRGKTEIRFSINCHPVIEEYERGTPSLSHRLTAAAKVAAARYPLGFLIAPVFVYEGWQTDYDALLRSLRKALQDGDVPLMFEVISHRFTSRAKGVIEEVYPGTSLPMDEKERRFKYGQFGYGKYVYPIETMEEMTNFFRERIGAYFPEARILYII